MRAFVDTRSKRFVDPPVTRRQAGSVMTLPSGRAASINAATACLRSGIWVSRSRCVPFNFLLARFTFDLALFLSVSLFLSILSCCPHGEHAFVSTWHSAHRIDTDRCAIFFSEPSVYWFDFIRFGMRLFTVRFFFSCFIDTKKLKRVSIQCETVLLTLRHAVFLLLCLIDERAMERPDAGNGGKNPSSA